MALSLLAANNAQTVLAAGISSTATSLTVNTGTGTLFPSPVTGTSFFKLTIIDAATGSLTEIVHVTARAGDVFTIQRGQEGTVPRAWSANDIVANMMTAGTLSYILGNFQPLDPTLTALAALVGVANKLPYFNGDDTAALTDLTQVGRDIIGKSTIADILTYLGLGDVLHAGKNLYEIAEKGAAHQASARDNLALNAIAAIVGGKNKLPYFADMNTAALADFTAFARTLLSRSDASAVRGDLGLKSAALRDVGTGASQIPDMSAFASVLAGNGKMRFPGGFLVQWGNAVPSVGTALVHYNEAFVDTPWFIGITTRQAGFPTAMQSIIVDDSLSNNTQFSARTLAFDGTTFAASTSAFYWYAIGRG